jgi:hypothetical protein
VFGLSGERGRNRTYNLLIKSQLLCQLSYAPTGGTSMEGRTKIIASLSRESRPAYAIVLSLIRATTDTLGQRVRIGPACCSFDPSFADGKTPGSPRPNAIVE